MPPHGSLANIEKLESDLWEAADNLRANSKLRPDEIAEAQECYYDALDAQTEDEALRLLSRALELVLGLS